MTQILTGIATNGLATASPWQNPIIVMPDGARVILYSDGTSLKLCSSPSGAAATWNTTTAINGTTATVIAAQASMVPTICAIATNTKLIVFTATSSGVAGYTLAYLGGGTFGAVASGVLVSGLPRIPECIACVYDPLAQTGDGNHVANTTGIVFLLTSAAGIWTVYSFDPHSTIGTVGGVKNVNVTATLSTGITSATSAVNMLLRQSGSTLSELYAVGPDATQWYAAIFDYVQTITPAGGNGTTTYTGSSKGSWCTQPSSGTQYFPQVGVSYEDTGYYVNGGWSPYQLSVQGGTWGYTMSPSIPIGGTAIPIGTWSVTLPFTTINALGSLGGTAHIYTKRGSILTSIGTVSATPITLPTGGGVTNLVCSAAFQGPVTLTAGDSFYVEVDLNATVGAPIIYHNDNGGNLAITPGVPTLAIPGGYSPPVTAYAITPVGGERPTISLSAQGAALAPSDTTSNPGVDLVVNGGPNVGLLTQTRGSAGGYGAALPLGSPALVASQGAGTTVNLTTGDKASWGLAAFSSVNHVAIIRRTGNAPNGPYKEDIDDASAVTAFVATQPNALATTGAAVAYLDTSSGVALHYEDDGAAGGANGPAAPVQIGTVGNNSAGVPPVMIVESNTPLLTLTYINANNPTDKCGSYRVVVSHTLPSAQTDWDSGIVPIPPVYQPISGQQVQVQYNNGNGAITNPTLTPGRTYTITAYTKEGISGTLSPSGTGQFTPYSAPTPLINSPAIITTTSFVVNFSYTQNESISTSGYDIQLQDPITGAVVWDSGTIAAVINTGSTLDSASLDISSGTISGLIKNNHNYNLVLSTYAPVTTSGNAILLGATTFGTYVQIPAPFIPAAVTATAVPGTTPTAGGNVAATWTQATGFSLVPNAASWNVYARATGTQNPWILQGNLVNPTPGTADAGTATLYSINNGVATDVAISAVSAVGIESSRRVATPPVTLTFRVGNWMNEVGNPANCVELGVVQGSLTSDYPMEWEYQQNRDYADLFNRTDPLLTIDTKFSRHISTTPNWSLEKGQEVACLALLRKWYQQGTTIAVRDIWGDTTLCTVIFREGAGMMPLFRQIRSFELQSVNTYGTITLLTP